MWVIRTARKIKNWIRVVFHPAARNWRETSTQTQQCMLQRDNTRKLGRRDEPSSSASARKLERGEDIQIGRSKMEFHNMQISDHQHFKKVFKKVFKKLQKRLTFAEETPIIGIEALRTKRIDLGIIYVNNDECRRSSWTTFHWTFRRIQEHKLPGTSKFMEYFSDVNIGRSSWDSGCDTDWLDSSLMSEIYTFSRSGEYVDERKSTCLLKLSTVCAADEYLLRFRFVREENVRSFRSELKVKKSSWRISTVQFLYRITWNWWRTDWVRGECFPGLTSFLQDRNIELVDIEDPIIFMSMFNNIEWTKKGNSEICISNSE